MARTQAANYEERRREIVEAAAKLYAHRGFLGASLSDLAAACRTSKSLIYHYYNAKEDILFDVMASHLSELDDALAAAIASTAAPVDRLRELSHAFMRHYLGAAARQKVLLNELGNLPRPRRALIVAHQQKILGVVKQLLEEIEPKLRRRKDLSTPVTMLFFGMINWTHNWYNPKGPVTPDSFADLVVDIMTGGLEKAV